MKIPVYDKPVVLSGRENMNRSVDGDIVAVEVFPEEEWVSPEEEVVEEDGNLTIQIQRSFFVNLSSSCKQKR